MIGYGYLHIVDLSRTLKQASIPPVLRHAVQFGFQRVVQLLLQATYASEPAQNEAFQTLLGQILACDIRKPFLACVVVLRRACSILRTMFGLSLDPNGRQKADDLA